MTTDTMPVPYYTDDLVTIYHGDSLRVMPLLEADVMVSDPPYGYAYASNKENSRWRGQQIANDQDVSCRDAILESWGDRPALVFGSWKRPAPVGTKNVVIWDKGDNPGMGDLSMPWGSAHEEIYILGTTDLWVGKRGGSVIRHQRIMGAQMLHQNEKPVPLMRDLISKIDPAAVIIDPFMGSGSTLRAAKDLGRHCIGIELDEKWCAVAASRLAQGNLFADVVNAPPPPVQESLVPVTDQIVELF